MITVNIYYTGRNGSARAFAEEMTARGIVAAIDAHHASPMMGQIAALREKYDLHMRVERFLADESGLPKQDMQFIKP